MFFVSHAYHPRRRIQTNKAGSVLLRTVEEIKRVVSYYRTTYRRGDKHFIYDNEPQIKYLITVYYISVERL